LGDGGFVKLQEKLHSTKNNLKLQKKKKKKEAFIPSNQQNLPKKKKIHKIPLAGNKNLKNKKSLADTRNPSLREKLRSKRVLFAMINMPL
jgi:hypothetical protein